MNTPSRLEALFSLWNDIRAYGWPVAPEELCDTCPELLEPLRALIRNLESMEAFVARAQSLAGPASSASPTGDGVPGLSTPDAG